MRQIDAVAGRVIHSRGSQGEPRWPRRGPRKRARREPMSRVDTAWLRMERPTNPMMITGVLMFAEPMSLERAQAGDRAALPRLSRASARRPSNAPPARTGRTTRTSTSTGTCACRAARARPARQTRKRRWNVSSASWLEPAGSRPSRYGSSTWSRSYGGGSRVGSAHPPLLRRWHRAGAGAAVADRHRARAGQGQAIWPRPG